VPFVLDTFVFPRNTEPLVSDDSVDCVVSNCVLNLVRTEDRRQMFNEIFRVLKCGGRAVISDIVADEDVPEHLQQHPELWSGCISGAFREDRFLQALEEAGFHGISVVSRNAEPWQVVEGLEFRSATVQLFNGKQGPAWNAIRPWCTAIPSNKWKMTMDMSFHVVSDWRSVTRLSICCNPNRMTVFSTQLNR